MAPGVARRGFGALLAGLPALAACARFPDLPDGPGNPIEADPLFREAAASAPVLVRPVSTDDVGPDGSGDGGEAEPGADAG